MLSDKYPLSLYPELISFVSGFIHSVGNTGNPNRSPSLLLNLPFPSGFNIKGKWQILVFYPPNLNIYTTKHVKRLKDATTLLLLLHEKFSLSSRLPHLLNDRWAFFVRFKYNLIIHIVGVYYNPTSNYIVEPLLLHF